MTAQIVARSRRAGGRHRAHPGQPAHRYTVAAPTTVQHYRRLRGRALLVQRLTHMAAWAVTVVLVAAGAQTTGAHTLHGSLRPAADQETHR